MHYIAFGLKFQCDLSITIATSPIKKNIEVLWGEEGKVKEKNNVELIDLTSCPHPSSVLVLDRLLSSNWVTAVTRRALSKTIGRLSRT